VGLVYKFIVRSEVLVLKTTLKKLNVLMALVPISSFLLHSPAISAAEYEEVTVTAQKREQSIQDVGISVTALGSEDMDELHLDDTADISQQVPALQLFQINPGLTIFNLRGLSQNNFTDTLEAPVAVYVDGVYNASLNGVGGQMFDMERVEVLRGPQGTLFGRNATGGVIHYLTKKADEDELNGYAEVGVGSYNRFYYEGAAGGAITDNVRGRFAAKREERDGYVEGVNDGVRDGPGADNYALRGTLQVDFSDSVTGDFKVAYSKDDNVPVGAVVAGVPGSIDPTTGFGQDLTYPDDIYESTTNIDSTLDREIADLQSTLTFDLDNGMQVVSITSYKTIRKDYLEDSDGIDGPTIGTPFDFTAQFDADTDQFSQELRLTGDGDNYRWTTGAYYLDFDIDSHVIPDNAPFPPFNGAGLMFGVPAWNYQTIDVHTQLESQNYSIFGEAEYDFNEKWTGIAGLRYSVDDKDANWTVKGTQVDGTVVDNVNNSNSDTLVAAGLMEDSIHYEDYAVRLQLNYLATDDLLLYTSFNRGIKGGNWTPPVTSDVDITLQHDEEVLYSYEIGSKYTLPEGKGSFNATAFYYDYKNYQAFTVTQTLVPQVTNTDAEVYGAELEFFYRPTYSVDLLVGASFLESEVDEVPDQRGGFVYDTEMPNAPGLSLNWMARYTHPEDIFGGTMSFQVDGNYNSEQYLSATNSEALKEDSYSVWNASMNYTSSDEHWKGSLWVKNITDQEYRVYALDLSEAGGTTTVFSPPLTVGASVAYHF